jgi:hypothetical protein
MNSARATVRLENCQIFHEKAGHQFHRRQGEPLRPRAAKMTTPAAMTATAPRAMWAGRRAIETGVTGTIGVTGTTVATEVTGATGTSVATEVNVPTGVTGAATLVAAMADDPVIVVAAVAVATATAAKDAARVATTIVAIPEVDVITWIPRPNSLHAARARSAMDAHSADISCACTYAMT